MPPEVLVILTLAPIAFLGSFVYGTTGFGAALLTIPLASHFYDLAYVLAVFALVDVVNATRVCFSGPRTIVRAEVARLVPSALVGVVVGTSLILVVPTSTLMAALGLFVLAFGLYSLASPARVPVIGIHWALPAGLSGGIASAIFGAGGPPYAIYLSLRPHSKEAFRSTLAFTSMVSIGARIVAFAAAGLLASSTVWVAALGVLPAALFALWCAERVHERLSRTAVLKAIQVLLCLAGLSLLVRAGATF